MSTLVLSRNRGESIMVGDDVEIAIVEVHHNGKVVLVISAPRAIAVHRKEIYQRIKRGIKRKESRKCRLKVV